MPKRIVICADGTWNRPEKDPQKDYPTNVLWVARAIRPVAMDGVAQQVFYDWGVGSYQDPWFAGCHGDVGGGHAPCPDSGSVLSAISLQWMVKQASQLGLGLDKHVAAGIKADPMAAMH